MARSAQDITGKAEVAFFKDDHCTISLLNDFSPAKQTWQLLRQQARGLIFTCALLLIYVGVLRAFEVQHNFNNYRKHFYNTLSAAILILLGLNFFEVFKDVAKTIRWRMLSRRSFTVREADLLLGAESLIKIFRLGFEAVPRKPLVATLCFAWLLLNLAAQVAVALLQLNASIEGGHDSNGTVIVPGSTVDVARLDCFYREGADHCDDSDDKPLGPHKQDRLDTAIAHTFGEAGLNSDTVCVYERYPEEILDKPQTCPYFRRTDYGQFAVRFADWDPEDATRAYPSFAAGRWLTVEAQNCSVCGVDCDKKLLGTTEGQDGRDSEFVWKAPPDSPGDSIAIPRVNLAAWSTTYVWNGTKLPSHEHPLQDCGPRCARLYAVRDVFGPSGEDFTVARCDVVVSDIAHATNDAHVLPDPVARTAGAAIALSGRWRALNWREQGVPDHPPKDPDWRQFQLYQEGTPMAVGLDESAPTAMGARMAEFAAASLGALAARNPRTPVRDGACPQLGYQLAVRWPYVSALAGGIALAHAALVALMLALARPVAVPDDSALVLARLLRGVVGGLPPSAAVARLRAGPLAAEIGAAAGEGKEGREMLNVAGAAPRERGRPLRQTSEGFRPLIGDERSASPRERSAGQSYLTGVGDSPERSESIRSEGTLH